MAVGWIEKDKQAVCGKLFITSQTPTVAGLLAHAVNQRSQVPTLAWRAGI